MKDDLKIIAIILLSFIIPLATSALLDLQWINSHWIRVALVIVLIVFELVIGGSMLKKSLETKK